MRLVDLLKTQSIHIRTLFLTIVLNTIKHNNFIYLLYFSLFYLQNVVKRKWISFKENHFV